MFALFFSIYLLAIRKEINEMTKRIDTGNAQDSINFSIILFYCYIEQRKKNQYQNQD